MVVLIYSYYYGRRFFVEIPPPKVVFNLYLHYFACGQFGGQFALYWVDCLAFSLLLQENCGMGGLKKGEPVV